MTRIRTADRPLDYSPLQPLAQPEHWTASFASWLLGAAFAGALFMLLVACGA